LQKLKPSTWIWIVGTCIFKFQIFDIKKSFSVNNDLEKRISDAFCVFDHHGDKFIDVREVGTVLRLLGCVPTEEEVNEVISATESEETSGEVHLTKFLPHVSQLLMERK